MRRLSLKNWFNSKKTPSHRVTVLKHGLAKRVIFYYPGEEGTYVDEAMVTIYENGIVHIVSKNEVSTTMLTNVEVLWDFPNLDDRAGKLRLIRSPAETPHPPQNP